MKYCHLACVQGGHCETEWYLKKITFTNTCFLIFYYFISFYFIFSNPSVFLSDERLNIMKIAWSYISLNPRQFFSLSLVQLCSYSEEYNWINNYRFRVNRFLLPIWILGYTKKYASRKRVARSKRFFTIADISYLPVYKFFGLSCRVDTIERASARRKIFSSDTDGKFSKRARNKRCVKLTENTRICCTSGF